MKNGDISRILEDKEVFAKKKQEFLQWSRGEQLSEIAGLISNIEFSGKLLAEFVSFHKIDAAVDAEAYDALFKTAVNEQDDFIKYVYLLMLNASYQTILTKANILDFVTKTAVCSKSYQLYEDGRQVMGCEYRIVSVWEDEHGDYRYAVTIMTSPYDAGGWGGKIPSCFMTDGLLYKEPFLCYTRYRYDVGPTDCIKTLAEKFVP